jgi:CHAD domain-containing protein
MVGFGSVTLDWAADRMRLKTIPMGYRIEKDEALSAAFGRIAVEEIGVAQGELHGRNRIEALHNARKALKRLRALLRSLRFAFPDELFRQENQRFAAVGRRIAPLRDVHVQLRTLARLNGGAGDVSGCVRRGLLRRERDYTRQIPEMQQAMSQMLDVSRQNLALWPVARATPPKVAGSLKRVYKAGRRCFKTALRDPGPEILHQWRKQAKTLGYGLELIRCIGPKKAGKWINRTEKLSEFLGDDHDLFLLQSALEREHPSLPAPDRRRLSKLITSKRAKLQKRAFKLGKRIFHQKPGAFEESLQRCLESECCPKD